MTKIYTRIVLDRDFNVLEADFFDYQGPMATCTGAEAAAPKAAEALFGGLGAEAAGGLGAEALGAELIPGVLAPEAGAALGAEGLGALGAEGLGAGIAALPEALGGFESLAGGGVGLAPETAGLGAEAVAAPATTIAPVGAGGVDIAGAGAGLDPALIGEPFTETTTATGMGSGTGGGALSPELIAEPPGTPGAQGPLGNIGQRLLDSITGNPLTAAALGLNAASAIGQRNAGKDAAGQLRAIGAPFSKEGESLLAQYHSGQLNPADEFNINKWEHEAIAQARGALGKQGGTALMSKIADIQARAQSMRDQALRGLLGEGLKASGMAVGPLSAAVTAQANQDHGFMQAQSGALNSLLMLQAMQGKGA